MKTHLNGFRTLMAFSLALGLSAGCDSGDGTDSGDDDAANATDLPSFLVTDGGENGSVSILASSGVLSPQTQVAISNEDLGLRTDATARDDGSLTATFTASAGNKIRLEYQAADGSMKSTELTPEDEMVQVHGLLTVIDRDGRDGPIPPCFILIRDDIEVPPEGEAPPEDEFMPPPEILIVGPVLEHKDMMKDLVDTLVSVVGKPVEPKPDQPCDLPPLYTEMIIQDEGPAGAELHGVLEHVTVTVGDTSTECRTFRRDDVVVEGEEQPSDLIDRYELVGDVAEELYAHQPIDGTTLWLTGFLQDGASRCGFQPLIVTAFRLDPADTMGLEMVGHMEIRESADSDGCWYFVAERIESEEVCSEEAQDLPQVYLPFGPEAESMMGFAIETAGECRPMEDGAEGEACITSSAPLRLFGNMIPDAPRSEDCTHGYPLEVLGWTPVE